MYQGSSSCRIATDPASKARPFTVHNLGEFDIERISGTPKIQVGPGLLALADYKHVGVQEGGVRASWQLVSASCSGK